MPTLLDVFHQLATWAYYEGGDEDTAQDVAERTYRKEGGEVDHTVSWWHRAIHWQARNQQRRERQRREVSLDERNENHN